MIAGFFAGNGRPFVQGQFIIPRLISGGPVDFLVDTGARATALHPVDAINFGLPFHLLKNPTTMDGLGGTGVYFEENAWVILHDDDYLYRFPITALIAQPNDDTKPLPSLLGRDVLNLLRMEYDRPDQIIQLFEETGEYAMLIE